MRTTRVRRGVSIVAGLAALAASGLLAAQGSTPAQAPPRAPGTAENGSCTFTSQTDVPTSMRDGVILRSNVFTPDGPGPFPVVMIRLPYNEDRPMTNSYGPPDLYASHCYIVVSQDVRGQYKSDGTWYPFRSEATDGYDTIEWAAKLPKSSGKVGMYGRSYPGATQWLPATLRPPHLTTIVPAMTSSDYHDNWNYDGGALLQAFAEDWPPESIAASAMRHFPDGAALGTEFTDARKDYLTKWDRFLPLKDWPVLHPGEPRIASYFYDWISHPDNDDYWKAWSIRDRWSQITVPALNLDGWYDIFLNGAVDNFSGMRKRGGSPAARDGQRLVIGPWVHISWVPKVGQLDFGPEAVNPMQDMMLRWYDYWLKGIQNGVDKEPRVRLFVMGANKWRTANEWPVEGTIFRSYYLHSQGAANTMAGNGTLDTKKPEAGGTPPDRFKYDPNDPVPSLGGRFMSVQPGGPYHQRPLLNRPDVLVYTTAPLEKDVEVTGPISVTLYAASSAPDTDFTAKLDDVYPDGRSMVLNYGIQRARYRESSTHPTLITPGQTYRYTITVWPTSNVFAAGHAIRVEISSSNFPMWDRNLNTGHPFGKDAEMRVADQTIFHDKDHPSSITLPIQETPIK